MITLYKGDDTGGQLGKNVKIAFHCDDAVDMDDVVVKFDLLGIVKREFTDVHDGDILDIFISHAESRKFPLGVIFAKMWGEDSSGKLRTFANRIPFRVTLNLIAVYGSDGTDSQDIHVYSSVDWDSIAGKPTVFPSSVEEVEGLQEALDAINEKIPEDASADNKLADKDWVDQQIDRVAAYYITSNAQGDPFPTQASLLNAETYYSGGSPRTPTRNDYAIVLADETHDDTEWRYIYSVNDQGVGIWEAQYPVEGAIVADDSVTKTSSNPVKSSGIWAALWGALAAIPAGFSSLYDWVVAQLGQKRNYTDRSYNTQVTVNAPALHAILTSRGTQLLEYYLPCTEDIPATPAINHVYTWRRDGAEFYITQGVSALTTIWTLYNSSEEQLARITTDNATQGYFPDLTFETSAYAAVTSTKVNSYPDEVQDTLALDSNIPAASTSLPRMDSPNGAIVGTPGKYACSDHVHPSDTSRVPTSRTINGKALSSDVTLDAGDVGALPSTTDGINEYVSADVHFTGGGGDITLPLGGTGTLTYLPSNESTTQNNLAAWKTGGGLGDSGKKPSDFQSALSAQQLANIAAVPNKANDADVVHNTGDEIIFGNKTFQDTAQFRNEVLVGSGALVVGTVGVDNTNFYTNGVRTYGHPAPIQYPAYNGLGKDFFALIQHIAPDYDGETSHTYAAYELRSYQGGIYRCTTAHTATAWVAANWAPATVEDVLAALRTGKADRVANPTAGNLAALDASGNPTDAGYRLAVRNGVPCIIQTVND